MADAIQPNQPTTPQPMTVMVKKADGTFERKTLDEIKAAKPAQQVPAPAPKPVSEPAKVMPVSARAAMLSQDKEEPVKPAAPNSSLPRENQVEEILRKSGAKPKSISADNRLRTLIQLAIKEIRTPDQVYEAVVRNEQDGGAGLTEAEAKAIMQFLPKTNQNLNAKLEKEIPAVTAPNNSIVRASAKPATSVLPAPQVAPKPQAVAPVAQKMPMDKQKVIETFSKNVPEEPYFKIPPSKSAMQDITSKQIAVGPIDEIKVFGLKDFRRLSANPEEAAMRLKQKFLNLKDESILLYMEGIEVWKHSELYINYINAVLGSLAKKQPLNVLSDKNAITVEEIKALIGMEKQLDYI